MDFTCIVLFLALYYLKPHEWSSIFTVIRFIPIVMFGSLFALFTRESGFRTKDFFRTPHDWAVYCFFLSILISSLNPIDTLKEDILNRLIFYVVTVHTLISLERLNKFLNWWTTFLCVVAFLALAGQYFWDPLGSSFITNSVMQGRLVLNLSMVNNPNALAHSLAPSLAMIYYCFFWKKTFLSKLLGITGIALVVFTIYLTQSKGGYYATGATIMAMLTFGRRFYHQILIGGAIMLVGSAILYSLPRMNEMKKTKSNMAIQGRVASFTNGYKYYQTYFTGIGYGQFEKRQYADYRLMKAPHSTYVAIGSQQGRLGMFIFILIMWSNFRTLIFMKTQNVEQERARRLLFTLVLSYTISGWMVDFEYRPTFFLMTAAVAAIHRLVLLRHNEDENAGNEWLTNAPMIPAPVANNPPLMSTSIAGMPHAYFSEALAPGGAPIPSYRRENIITEVQNSKSKGIGLMDLAIVFVLQRVVEEIWMYCIKHM